MASMILATAPNRIDFSGGYTDVPPFTDETAGKSVNAAVTLYTRVQAVVRGDRRIRIRSLDLDTFEEVASVDRLRPTGALGLIKRALLSQPAVYGVDLLCWSDAPPGSGLGTSGAVSVALQLVVATLSGRRCSPAELAERAARCQREHGISGGCQDEYAAAFGGIQHLTFHGTTTMRRVLTPCDDELAKLENRFLLLHGGGAHDSGSLVDEVMRRLASHPGQMRPVFLALNDLADDLGRCLESGCYGELPGLVDQVFSAQCKLGRGVVPERLAARVAEIRRAGACCKPLGGGGNGAALLACSPPQRRGPIREVARELGFQALPFRIATEGAGVVPIRTPRPLRSGDG